MCVTTTVCVYVCVQVDFVAKCESGTPRHDSPNECDRTFEGWLLLHCIGCALST